MVINLIQMTGRDRRTSQVVPSVSIYEYWWKIKVNISAKQA
jgi:hypothetical protein